MCLTKQGGVMYGCNTSLVCCIFMKKDIRNRTAWINAEPKFQYGCHGVNWDTNHGVNWDTYCTGTLTMGSTGTPLIFGRQPCSYQNN